MVQRRVIVNRAFACLIHIIFLALFIYQSSQCVLKFVNRDTSTHLDILSTKSAHFPQLSVCPDYGYAYKTDILKSYNTTPQQIRDFIYPEVENMTSYEFHDLVTYDIDEVLDSLEIATAQSIDVNNTTPTFKIRYTFRNVSKDTFELTFGKNDWTESRYNTFGKCFSFNTPNFIQKSEIKDIAIVFNMNSVVYFHQAGQLHNRDTDTKIKAVSGEQLFVDLRHEITVDMPRKLAKNEGSGSPKYTCVKSVDYFQDNCLTKGLDFSALETIGCTFPTFTMAKSKSCDAKWMNESQKEELNKTTFEGKNKKILQCIFEKKHKINSRTLVKNL